MDSTQPLKATRQGKRPANEAGRFTPQLPTDGRELIAAWELPAEAWQSETVKVSRYFPGTQQVELVQSLPLQAWTMEETAAQFGPGRYRITPGPGPHGRKQTEMTVSEEYARAAGWATAPPAPSFREIQARRTFEAAARGPVDPVDLAAMIETAVARAVERITPKTQDSGMDALALVLKGFDLAGTLQAKALETAQKMSGIAPAAPAEKEPATMADVLLQLGPQLLQTINHAVTTHRPAAPTAAPQPQQRQTLPAPAAPQGAQPMPQQPQQSQPFPTLTDEERQAIAPAVGLLAPHGAQLAQAIKSPVPASMIASNLLGYIGPDMEAPILALAAVVETHGPAILSPIHPELATTKTAEVMSAIAHALDLPVDE